MPIADTTKSSKLMVNIFFCIFSLFSFLKKFKMAV